MVVAPYVVSPPYILSKLLAGLCFGPLRSGAALFLCSQHLLTCSTLLQCLEAAGCMWKLCLDLPLKRCTDWVNLLPDYTLC